MRLCGAHAHSGVACVQLRVSFRGTRHELLGVLPRSFQYDAPVVRSILPMNIPSSNTGTTISISGLNFGVADTDQAVRIGDTRCQRSQWVSDSSLLCVGEPLLRPLSVAVNGQTIVADWPVSYDAPIVTMTAGSANGPTEGRSVLTILGTNFGARSSLGTPRPSVTIGQSKCDASVWISTTAVACVTPAGTGTTCVACCW